MNNNTIFVHIMNNESSYQRALASIEVFGRDKVVGVILPDIFDKDTDVNVDTCKRLGIEHITIPVGLPVMDIINQMDYAGLKLGGDGLMKLPELIRGVIMDVLKTAYREGEE